MFNTAQDVLYSNYIGELGIGELGIGELCTGIALHQTCNVSEAVWASVSSSRTPPDAD